jgi:hypothetical protein
LPDPKRSRLAASGKTAIPAASTPRIDAMRVRTEDDTMPKLTVEAVRALVRRALFEAHELVDGKAPADAVMVKGLVAEFGFNRERLLAAKPEIDALLAELPPQFQKSTGGGWTFLNACNDKHGRQWADEHRDMEALFCLGIGVGSASWMLANMADSLPGGVPYVEVHPSSGVAA